MQNPEAVVAGGDRTESIAIDKLVNCTGRKLAIRTCTGSKTVLVPVALDLFVQRMARSKVLTVVDQAQEYGLSVLEYVGIVSELPPPRPGTYYIVEGVNFVDLAHFRDDVLEPSYLSKDGDTMIVTSLRKVKHDERVAVEVETSRLSKLPPDYFLTLDAMLSGAIQSRNINICNMLYSDAAAMVESVFFYLYDQNGGGSTLAEICNRAIEFVLCGGMVVGSDGYQLGGVTYTTRELMKRMAIKPVRDDKALVEPMLYLGNRILSTVHDMTGYPLTETTRVKFGKLLFDELAEADAAMKQGLTLTSWHMMFSRILFAALRSMDREVTVDAEAVQREIVTKYWGEAETPKD